MDAQSAPGGVKLDNAGDPRSKGAIGGTARPAMLWKMWEITGRIPSMSARKAFKGQLASYNNCNEMSEPLPPPLPDAKTRGEGRVIEPRG